MEYLNASGRFARWQDSQDAITDAVSRLLIQRLAVREQGKTNGEWDEIYPYMLGYLLWRYTEVRGKYKGCMFWSREAVRLYGTHREAIKAKSCSVDGKSIFVHEHVVPKKVIRSALLALTEPTVGEVRSVLDQLAVAAVVAKAEDKRLSSRKFGLRQKMPAGWNADGGNPWARYAKATIRMDQHALLPARHRDWMSAAGLFVCRVS